MDYVEIKKSADKLRAFTIIIGARGVGKTYGAIDFLMETGKKFIYMRNTDVQLKECATAFGNPFKRWSIDHDRSIRIEKQGMHGVIVEDESEDKKELGYAVALSTFENLRGVDLSDVDYVLFDEFIERRTLFFNQYEAFYSFYETVNRNRELNGEKPLIVIMLSNAQKLNNPILAGYGFIPIIEKMIKTNKKEYLTRHVYIYLPESDISNAKSQTANYALTAGSKIYQEAIENKFSHDSFYRVGKQNIIEYIPVCKIDDIYIYKHKSKKHYYVTHTNANNIEEYTTKDSRTYFLRKYGLMLREYGYIGEIYFEDYVCKMALFDILK